MYPISLYPITLGIHLHHWHHIIELHVLLPYLPTTLHCLHSFLEIVLVDDTGFDRSGGDEGDGCAGNVGGEHGTHEDGLNGGDGGVGVALNVSVSVTRTFAA